MKDSKKHVVYATTRELKILWVKDDLSHGPSFHDAKAFASGREAYEAIEKLSLDNPTYTYSLFPFKRRSRKESKS